MIEKELLENTDQIKRFVLNGHSYCVESNCLTYERSTDLYRVVKEGIGFILYEGKDFDEAIKVLYERDEE